MSQKVLLDECPTSYKMLVKKINQTMSYHKVQPQKKNTKICVCERENQI